MELDDTIVPSKKKPSFPISKALRKYLLEQGREANVNVIYSDMLRYAWSIPLLNNLNEDTLWESVYYDESEREELFSNLKHVYALLKTDGDIKLLEHLGIARIDYCTFGNSKPFRVRVINRLNDNYDHFYVKIADSSRVYGLELENILSPNWFNYITNGNTIFEEHIAGVPGDSFIKEHLDESKFNQIRICKEFVKFNERCFIRLLGDMRSYNYIVDITPDIEGNQYRFRAIDFDQQCYEERKKFYLPHFFKENNPINFLGFKLLSPTSVKQYREEERTLILHRKKSEQQRLELLLRIMKKEELSKKEKIEMLKTELADHHGNQHFLDCKNMGDIVQIHLDESLNK